MNTREKGKLGYTTHQVPPERHRQVMDRLKELGYPMDKERGYVLFFVSGTRVVQELRVAVEELRRDTPIWSVMEGIGDEAQTILRLSQVPFDDGYAVFIIDEALTDAYRFSRDMGLLSN